MTTDTLLEGITIGASAGLISGLILGSLHWLKSVIQSRTERREQVRHLARTIEQSRDTIYSASDLDLREYSDTLLDLTDHPVGRMFPRDEVRKAQLQWLHQQIQQILLGRASHLSFDEIQQIKQAFNAVELYPNWVPNDKGYEGIFNQLESVGWLRLNPLR